MKNKAGSSVWVIFIIVGAVMAGVGFLFGGNTVVYADRSGVYTEEVEQKKLHVTEQLVFDTLDVKVSVADVKVIAGDKFEIEAEYNDGQEPGYTIENGVLKVFDSGSTWKPFRFTVGFVRKNNWMTVKVPTGTKIGSVSVHADVGDVALESIDVGTVDAGASTGKLVFRHVKCDELNSVANVGEIILDRVSTVGKLTAKSGTGKITGSSLESATAELRSDVGDVKIEQAVTGGLVAQSGTGNVEIEGELRGETRITTAVGGIEVDTKMGRDEFLVTAKADVGRVKVEPKAENPASAPNEMTLKSGTGSIRATFANP